MGFTYRKLIIPEDTTSLGLQSGESIDSKVHENINVFHGAREYAVTHGSVHSAPFWGPSGDKVTVT